MADKSGCYIFLHIKRNCEIFIFECAKIMKIVRIHILIQKNFHVIRLKKRGVAVEYGADLHNKI